MANSKQSQSKTFPIVISVIVLVMIGVVVFTVTSNKKDVKAQSKVEYSDAPIVSAVSVNGKLGESSLPSSDAKAADGTDAAIGLIVPQITAQQFTGVDTTVTPGKKPYVLAFVAHWCPHCQKEVPAIVKLNDNGELPKDVEFVAVATATTDTKPNYPPSKWLLTEDWPWRKIADDNKSTIASKFGLTGYPYLIFINADGTVSARLSGEQDDSTYIATANKIAQSAKK